MNTRPEIHPHKDEENPFRMESHPNIRGYYLRTSLNIP